ncbi:hypothetical protein O6H91_20G045000 [Diphasiastrum complanatum]|uniref:Uncharacterized protein n=1 Tax=Diphasiastrum complanatum TaxID=34168 RepID=A0ACC2AQZ0_DIPCM|nr:hypothetical protein O6H91_20G045000 [Diphasiastrum complanatum]
MAPKRKASAAKQVKKEIRSDTKEASKEKEAAPEVEEKQPAKKVKPETPSSPVKTRGRPDKTLVAESKEAAKPKETRLKGPKPSNKESKIKGSKSEEAMKAAEVPEAAKKVKDAPQPPAAEPKHTKNIIIEHCKQCNSFKTRALKVKESLEIKVQGIKVFINLEKPRKGCFEIRDEQGNIFVSFLDMPRPFKKLKELNLDTIIDEIAQKLKTCKVVE